MDCFAGPWGAPDDDLEGTSISLSLKTLAACKEKLATLGVDATMRALYVEKDLDAFGRLSKFLSSKAPPSVGHACQHGDFVDLRNDILRWCGPGWTASIRVAGRVASRRNVTRGVVVALSRVLRF